jgi:fused signal recognition particle receptor
MDNTVLIAIAVVVLLAAVAGVIWWVRRRETRAVGVEEKSESRGMLAAGLSRIWRAGLDDSTWERLEEVLLRADVGVEPTRDIVDRVRSAGPSTLDEARPLLASALRSQFEESTRDLDLSAKPTVILIVGVNGSGKTTSIAKLAHRLQEEGKSVLLGAADTFRAAAGEQLDTWASRVGVDLVKGQQGGDPASVAFDAIASAKAKGLDVVIIDTAGRLHGKKNLMAELQKIHRVASGEATVAEVLLVLDATSGQNGLAQVEQFGDAVALTGIILAKLDGTARGGIVVAVENRLGVPVKFVGVGEDLGDLREFEPDGFVSSLVED